MNTPTLGKPRFASNRTHTVSDDIRIPERIETGEEPGLQFELAGPRAKLFFDGKETRAGIVTCGGLCPGLNNVIRSLFLELHYGYGVAEVLGFRGGYSGLDPACGAEPVRITPQLVDDIHHKGGTILGTGRDKPHRMEVDGEIRDMTDVIAETYHHNRLDALVCIGGGGTHKNILRLMDKGLNIVSLPKTIDNDLALTDTSIGFDTALGIVTEVVDRLHSTAHSHHRIIVAEIMGNRAGWLVPM